MVKVGDRVRSLVDETDLCSNKIYEVVSVGRHSVNVEDDAGDEHFLFEGEYEPVAVADSNGNQPKFRVGDRVRALDSCGGGGFVAGDVYTVSRVYEDYSGTRINVEVDSVGSKTNGWGAWHFEPLDAPLTIRYGKFYRTRDGRKVGPAEVSDDYEYPWRASGALYLDNGRWLYDDIEDDNDIIAEWSDEPVAAGDSSNADIFDKLEDWMADNPLPEATPTTGFTVPLDAPEFGGELEVTAPTLDDLYAAKCMVETGVCTINEVRSRLGLPPHSTSGHLLAAV